MSSWRKQVWRPAGFTLVELLVVVAIISILAALLLPALGKALETARQAGCTSNNRQMSIGVNLYADDNEDWAPPSFYDTVTRSPHHYKWTNSDGNAFSSPKNHGHYNLWVWAGWGWTVGEAGKTGMGFLFPDYAADGGIFFCPAATYRRFDDAPPAGWPTESNRKDGTESWYNFGCIDHSTQDKYCKNTGVYKMPNDRGTAQFSQLAPNTALYSDMYMTTRNHATGWNALYADGASRYVTSMYDYYTSSALSWSATMIEEFFQNLSDNR